ncbi:SWAHC protein, partial [Polyodon spathula]|nr:SWAHC protein [Polyodon spathula]
MATECTQDAVLQFLTERGGKVRNVDLIDQFKPLILNDPAKKALAKERFKEFVDTVGFVKVENDVKYVCLKKKYRDTLKQRVGKKADGDNAGKVEPAVGAASPIDQNSELCSDLDNKNTSSSTNSNADSCNRQRNVEFILPSIAVTEASPLPTEVKCHTFSVPENKNAERIKEREQQSGKLAEDRTTYCQPDSSCASGTESGGSTPKGSRKIFRDMMMNNSPQLRRSMALKTPGSLLPRWRDSMKSESDSVSLVSSTDEDSRSLALDPMEHEWMMCASDGQWESLNRLLACDPNLVIKRDFVTGFTCLHWAAKHGKQELIALLVNFAKQHAVPLNINTRSSAGYTPLHLAAMHNHEQVVKLLVGAYDADVDIRDYSGKKAWQYLRENVGGDIRDIVGAAENSDADNLGNGAGRWRLSKVLPSNLLPHKLLNLPEDDSCVDGAAVKPKSVYRQTSMSRIRPKLKQIRFKTQIIHSSFFKETEDGERPLKSPAKSRPKSNLFG